MIKDYNFIRCFRQFPVGVKVSFNFMGEERTGIVEQHTISASVPKLVIVCRSKYSFSSHCIPFGYNVRRVFNNEQQTQMCA